MGGRSGSDGPGSGRNRARMERTEAGVRGRRGSAGRGRGRGVGRRRGSQGKGNTMRRGQGAQLLALVVFLLEKFFLRQIVRQPYVAMP